MFPAVDWHPVQAGSQPRMPCMDSRPLGDTVQYKTLDDGWMDNDPVFREKK